MKNILFCLSALLLLLVSCSDELKINGIKAYPENITLIKGDSIRVHATIDFEGGKYNEPSLIKLGWNSDNEHVATVDSTGFVRTHNIGSSNIIVTCENCMSQCEITFIESSTEASE